MINSNPMKNSFDYLISPYTRERFFQEYFEKKHLHIVAQDAQRFAHLLSERVIEDILTNQKLTLPNTRMAHKDSDLDANELSLEGTNIIDVNKVIEKYAEGATLILSQLQDRLGSLKGLCDSLASDFGQRFQTNVYCTPGNSSQGFSIHHDTHDVFILQIEGSKEWKIYESPIELAIKDQGFKPEEHIPGAIIDQFTMNPGDMLYIPRGLMHAAKTTDRKSIHITTGFMGYTWQDFFIDQINRMSQEHSELRKGYQPDFWNRPGEYESQYMEILKLFKQSGQLESGLNRLYQKSVNRLSSNIESPLQQADAIHKIALDSVVYTNHPLMHQVEIKNEHELAITIYNKEIVLPVEFQPVVEYIFKQRRLKVSDLPLLDDDSKLSFIRMLLNAGAIRVALQVKSTSNTSQEYVV